MVDARKQIAGNTNSEGDVSRVIGALFCAFLAVPGCGSQVAGSGVEDSPVHEEAGTGLKQPDVVVRYGAAELVLTPWSASWEGEPNEAGEVEAAIVYGTPLTHCRTLAWWTARPC